MRRIKRFLFIFLAILLVVPTLVAADYDAIRKVTSQKEGQFSSKDEVVYSKLDAAGERQEIYVVNIFEVEKAGKISDYGTYDRLKNLTDLSKLEQADDQVFFTAEKGRFYYQGNVKDLELPWKFQISYFIDGQEISPEELAGRDGHLEIRIATSANVKGEPAFYENYLLQISLTLNLERSSNLKAPKAMLANAGKNKIVTFTAMPEKDEVLTVTADVIDFAIDGIEISAVPASLPIDAPNVDEMTGEMNQLAQAIQDLDHGVGKLKYGISELNSGIGQLRDGSAEYHSGISTLSQSSTELIQASEQIADALDMIDRSLLISLPEDIDLSELKKIEEGIQSFVNGIREAADRLAKLKNDYSEAKAKLAEVFASLPDVELSEKELEKLTKSGLDPELAEKLLQTYQDALQAKKVFLEEQFWFDKGEQILDILIAKLNELVDRIDSEFERFSSLLSKMDLLGSFTQLQEGISELSSGYKEFHSGLVGYTGGVKQMADSYGEMHNGLEDLTQGTGELEKGTGQLHEGTGLLSSATGDLPEQIREKVDEMIKEYDKSDFEPVSFVSPKNEKMNSVQFVFTTEGINKEAPEKQEESEEKKKEGFWTRLLNLFR